MASEQTKPNTRRLTPPGAALAVLLACAGALCLVQATGRHWIRPLWLADCLTGKLFLTAGLVLVGSTALLTIVLAVLWQAGRANRRRPGPQEGTVMLEFALALPVALVLVLIMAQSALLMVGNICVHYASYCAVRSAIVNVPIRLGPFDNPIEAENVLNGSTPQSSEKMRRIYMAAVWAVLPMSCSSTDVPEALEAPVLRVGLESYFTRYGGTTPYWATALLGRKLSYALSHTSVELEPPADGQKYAAREDIEVRVRHEFYMAIPYANKLFAALGDADNIRLPFGQDEWAMVMYARCRLTNEGEQTYVEKEIFPRSN